MGLRAVVARMIGWQVKAIAAAVILAALGGLLAHDHFVTRKLNATRHELASANATIEAEREARAHELKIAKEASDDYQSRLDRLEAERADIPVRTVRLCRSPSNPVPSASGTASGTDAGVAAEQPAEAGRDLEAGPDIGAALYALADQADERAAQCNALIKWVRSR